jgi:hypothetical protein
MIQTSKWTNGEFVHEGLTAQVVAEHRLKKTTSECERAPMMTYGLTSRAHKIVNVRNGFEIEL